MAHRAPQDDHWRGLRLAVPARRTRVIAAMIGVLLSLATPVLVWGAPGLTADGQPTRPPDDPAGLGITGALPGDPLPNDLVPGDPPPNDLVPGDQAPGDEVPGDEVPRYPTPPTLPDGPLGIPGVVLGAYQRAEQTLAASQPGCHLSWSVLAGIGRIESGHARDGRVDTAGNTLTPILGPPLDGSPGVAAIVDTDRGVLDHDTVWDRAVGSMQFIPASWRSYGVDGNRDGLASPHNIYDATTAAGRYLCAGGSDLTDPAHLQAAVFRYNHSATYVTIVLRWAQAYLSGVVPTPPATSSNSDAATVVDGALQAAAAPATPTPPTPPLPPETPTPPAETPTPPAETPTPTPLTPTPVTTPLPVTPLPVTPLPVTPMPTPLTPTPLTPTPLTPTPLTPTPLTPTPTPSPLTPTAGGTVSGLL